MFPSSGGFVLLSRCATRPVPIEDGSPELLQVPPGIAAGGLLVSRGNSMARARSTKQSTANGAPLGFEQKLWAAADALRNNMDAAEYKHVVLGLIFLKFISDA